MIDISIYTESVKLEAKYQERWGKDMDYVALPNSISQEQLLLAQRRMVDTGESTLVALEKIRDFKNEYAHYLDTLLPLENNSVVDKACPLCGNQVVYSECGGSYSFDCKTENCFKMTFRGI